MTNEALYRHLEEQYGIKASAIVPAKRGFFGETWRVQAEACAFFVKLDCWESHMATFRESLPALHWLDRQNLDFIAGPVRTLSGALHSDFSGGVLGVFPFIEGENREDYPVEQLFLRLRQVYALDTTGLSLPEDAFDCSVLLKVEGLLQQLERELPEYALMAFALFKEHEALISHCARRLKEFIPVCRHTEAPLYLTHGDAGGNCILHGERFTIIDWDQVRLAPIERDAWFFMQDCGLPPWEQIRRIRQVLAPYALDSDRLCYYCYNSFFTYLGEYLGAIRKPGGAGRSREVLVGMLRDYFNSWIRLPLQVADTLVPGRKR